MITEDTDLGEYVRECLLDASPDEISDPYKAALRVRAALCAAALEIRAYNRAGAEQLLKVERAIAAAMQTGSIQTPNASIQCGPVGTS